jgi:opacity protein-like surface antigen
MKSALLAAATVCALSASVSASAGWNLTLDGEHFRWAESTSPRVTETGPRIGIGGGWTQDQPWRGWQFAWRGKLYFGSVDYDGSTLLPPQTPVKSTTEYRGLVNEGQASYRFPGNSLGAEFVAGLGLDLWERRLSSFQSEDWRVLFVRLGANLDKGGLTGWFGGAGFKYPVYVDQDAHFPSIGFSPNPHLRPKGELSLYGQLGYRFSRNWNLSAYYDSYRFRESGDVSVRDRFTGTPQSFFQPESSIDSFGLRLQYRF